MFCPPLYANTASPHSPSVCRHPRTPVWSRLSPLERFTKRFEWATEGYVAWGIGIGKARVARARLSEQVEVIDNATQASLRLLNIQLQEASRMTLQNRLVLDTLLLYQGGCVPIFKLISRPLLSTYPKCHSPPRRTIRPHEEGRRTYQCSCRSRPRMVGRRFRLVWVEPCRVAHKFIVAPYITVHSPANFCVLFLCHFIFCQVPLRLAVCFCIYLLAGKPRFYRSRSHSP